MQLNLETAHSHNILTQTWEFSRICMSTSGSSLANISVRPPRELSIFTILKKKSGSKHPENSSADEHTQLRVHGSVFFLDETSVKLPQQLIIYIIYLLFSGTTVWCTSQNSDTLHGSSFSGGTSEGGNEPDNDLSRCCPIKNHHDKDHLAIVQDAIARSSSRNLRLGSKLYTSLSLDRK